MTDSDVSVKYRGFVRSLFFGITVTRRVTAACFKCKYGVCTSRRILLLRFESQHGLMCQIAFYFLILMTATYKLNVRSVPCRQALDP